MLPLGVQQWLGWSPTVYHSSLCCVKVTTTSATSTSVCLLRLCLSNFLTLYCTARQRYLCSLQHCALGSCSTLSQPCTLHVLGLRTLPPDQSADSKRVEPLRVPSLLSMGHSLCWSGSGSSAGGLQCIPSPGSQILVHLSGSGSGQCTQIGTSGGLHPLHLSAS